MLSRACWYGRDMYVTGRRGDIWLLDWQAAKGALDFPNWRSREIKTVSIDIAQLGCLCRSENAWP